MNTARTIFHRENHYGVTSQVTSTKLITILDAPSRARSVMRARARLRINAYAYLESRTRSRYSVRACCNGQPPITCQSTSIHRERNTLYVAHMSRRLHECELLRSTASFSRAFLLLQRHRYVTECHIYLFLSRAIKDLAFKLRSYF